MDVKTALISFAEDYLKSNSVCVHRVVPPCGDCSWIDFGLRRALSDGQGYRSLQRYLEAAEQNTIYHLTDEFGCIYTIFRLPDSAELMVCGPVVFGNERLFIRTAQNRQELPPGSASILQDFYLQVAVFQHPMAHYNLFKTLGARIYGEEPCKIVNDSLGDCEYWYDAYQQGMHTEEDAALKNRAAEKWYVMESELIEALCRGNESDILKAVSKLQSIALLALMPSEVQDVKARMIVIETLMRKSAELSGVSPILIDPHSRRHIQLIGKIVSNAEMNALLMQFSRDYYRLIHRSSLKDYSLLTQKIITLIGQDITADLSLSALSAKLNASAKYLSALFKREVGITLTDYVTGQRIELAKRLLLFTDFPIKTISQKCGVPDIHYFSHLFKRKVGCTPKFFRENRLRS